MQAARGASLNPSDPADEPVDEVRRATARTRSLVIFASLAAVGYAVDVVSKVVAVARLTDHPPVPVVGDLLQLYLARIADGTYGICESCGNPIGKGRAMAFPRATLCLTCKQREERR